MTLEERFWRKVRKTRGCWLWTGHVGPHGYGSFAQTKNRRVAAHRFALSLKLGRPVEGLALHSCDNRRCVKFDHLREGTMAENARDAKVRERVPRGSAHWNSTLDEKTVRRLYRDYLAGISTQELGRKYGLSSSQVSRVTHGETWGHLTGANKDPAARHYVAKLTENQALDILARYRPGLGAELAREFGVNRTTISTLVLGKTWKHLHRDPLAPPAASSGG